MTGAAVSPLGAGSVQDLLHHSPTPKGPKYLYMAECRVCIWESPKIRGTLFWCSYNKDPTI